RKSVRWAEPLQEWRLPAGAASVSSAHDLLAREEQLSHLREAIRGLDEELYSPFVAAVFDGYTYDEVAEMLGIPVGTVGYRVYQARRKICRQMRELFPEE
ncbi:MAG: RNA polymerase sigma factor, partial [Planctomycetes bacterium]|nr:RNA polymerase sigma factor [Planctomycetota bacterium]